MGGGGRSASAEGSYRCLSLGPLPESPPQPQLRLHQKLTTAPFPPPLTSRSTVPFPHLGPDRTPIASAAPRVPGRLENPYQPPIPLLAPAHSPLSHSLPFPHFHFPHPSSKPEPAPFPPWRSLRPRPQHPFRTSITLRDLPPPHLRTAICEPQGNTLSGSLPLLKSPFPKPGPAASSGPRAGVPGPRWRSRAHLL